MMSRAAPYTAAASASGYLYQCRCALKLLLERAQADPDAALSLERFDDIAFEVHGTPLELIQTKHHLGRSSDLTDGSAELWKTIRVWAEGLAAGTYTLPQTSLTIVTTAAASIDGAAACLRPGAQRNPGRALELLEMASAAATGGELAPARAAYHAITTDQRRSLVEAIHVLDGSPDINASAEEIRRTLGFVVSTACIAAFQERLEGWWLGQVILRLTGEVSRPITGVDLLRAVDDLRESFRQDSLPIDFLHAEPAGVAHPDQDERNFMRQLRLICLGTRSMRWAQVDYYRAYAQRSRWLKDGLVTPDQLDGFDWLLTEDWDRRRAHSEDVRPTASPALDPVVDGQALYQHLQENCRSIRLNCTEPYVGRGSYQMLADQVRVGWHPNYEALLNRSTAEARS